MRLRKEQRKPYKGSCQPRAERLIIIMTAPNIHRINSDHFKPVPIGDQWNNCRKIVYKKAPNGMPMRATPAIVPSSVIIGDTEATGIQSMAGSIS